MLLFPVPNGGGEAIAAVGNGICCVFPFLKATGEIPQCWHDEIIELPAFLLHLALLPFKTGQWKLEDSQVSTLAVSQRKLVSILSVLLKISKVLHKYKDSV
jgi:hypothetical protein